MAILYLYARDVDGQIVHIDNVSQGTIYYCPQCGNEMIAKKGEINAHHFAHKVECSCSGESYLHKVAKEKFKEIFDNSTEFILEYRLPVNCPFHLDSKTCMFAEETCNSFRSTPDKLDLKNGLIYA